MSPSVQAIPGDPKQSSTKAIEPYVNGLRAWRDAVGRDPDGLPAAPLMIAGRQFELASDLWAEIDTYLDSPADVQQGDMAWLLTYGVALSVKSLTDMNPPAAADAEVSEPGYVNRAELMLNASMGRSLVRKTQQAIDRSLASGNDRRARSLGSFQRQLRGVHLEVRAALTDLEGPLQDLPEQGAEESRSTRDEKPTLSDIGPGTPSGAVRTRKASARGGRPTRSRNRPVADEGPTPKYTALLLVLLAGALIARLALFPFGIPFVETDDPFAAVSSSHATVLGVQVSPPTVFVTVDPVSWSEADLADREAWIGQIVKEVRGADRSAAHLMYPDGTPAGRWTVQGGSEILDPEAPVIE